MGDFNERLAREFVEREVDKDQFWYSFSNQKALAFHIARDLVVHADMEVVEAIELSKEFVDEFYHHAIKPKSWERK